MFDFRPLPDFCIFSAHSFFGIYHLPNIRLAYVSLLAPKCVLSKRLLLVALPIYNLLHFAADF